MLFLMQLYIIWDFRYIEGLNYFMLNIVIECYCLFTTFLVKDNLFRLFELWETLSFLLY